MKRIISIMLALVLAINLTTVVVFSVGSLNLTCNTPSSGYDTLSIKWNSCPNVDFYAYSIRDLDTNQIVNGIDRIHTSRTYANISCEWDAGHTYRVWAGACCYGNDPNNTSTWTNVNKVDK